jgi:diguanylate cyclase (GGDEF)-like protein
MKIHPVVGAEILESVRFPYPVVPIVRHHHEKWDGSGYPDGLVAEDIPLGARILSAVDCFDALSSDRQYRRALPVHESMAYLEKEAGRAFDPRVVKIMSKRYLELEIKARNHSDSERAKLSVDVKVARGDAPDAGFAAEAPKSSPDRSEFVESIASARAEAQFLFSVSQDLTLSIDLETMFERLAEKLRTTIPFETIAYYHIEGEALNPLFVAGNEEDLFRSLRIPIGQGLSGWVVHEKKTILNGNPAVEPGFLKDRRVITNLRSALSVPVEGESGVIGALTLYSMSRDQYSRDHLRVLMSVATRLAFQVENSLRFQKASGDAYIDELTGLSNSRWLVSHLETTCGRAAAEAESFAIVVLDLDGFKTLNDTFGHLRGNDALREVASRSRLLLPPGSSMARMGGDEFVVILPRHTTEEAMYLAHKIQKTTELVGVEITEDDRLSASWGVSVFGADGLTPQMLMAEADRRMYENKKSKQTRMAARLSRLAAGVEGKREVVVDPVRGPVAGVRR